MKMSFQQYSSLLEKCLAGDATPTEEQAVVKAAGVSKTCRDALMDSAALDSLLRTAHQDETVFARTFIEQMTQKGHSGRFAATMVRKLNLRAGTASHRQFLAKKQSRATWVWWLSAAACLMALAANYHFSQPTPSTTSARMVLARIVEVKGEGLCRRNGCDQALCAGTAIYDGDELQLMGGGKVVFAYQGEKTRVALLAASRVLIREESGAKRLQLIEGALQCHVAPQSHPMLIDTAESTCEVRGTSFLLRSVQGSSYLEVQKGSVQMTQREDGAAVMVETGMYAVAAKDSLLKARALARIDRALFFGENTEAVGYAAAAYKLLPYVEAKQKGRSSLQTVANGATLSLTGNGMVKVDLEPLRITENTVLEFDFSCDQIGKVHAIHLDTNSKFQIMQEMSQPFVLYGTKKFLYGVNDSECYRYAGSAPTIKHYVIPVGEHCQGVFRYLFFMNTQNKGKTPAPHSVFSNVRIYRKQ